MTDKKKDEAYWQAKAAEGRAALAADKPLARRVAIEDTEKWMDAAIRSVERHVEQLKRYRDDFTSATTSDNEPQSPISVLMWFINDLTQVTSNTRIDLATKHAAALAWAQPEDNTPDSYPEGYMKDDGTIHHDNAPITMRCNIHLSSWLDIRDGRVTGSELGTMVQHDDFELDNTISNGPMKVLFDYPLERSVTFETTPARPEGMTYRDFINFVASTYESVIYTKEDKWGIWGHRLGDLFLEGADLKNGIWHLVMGS